MSGGVYRKGERLLVCSATSAVCSAQWHLTSSATIFAATIAVAAAVQRFFAWFQFGVVAYRRRLDGSARAHFNVTGDAAYARCAAGCASARSSTAAARRANARTSNGGGNNAESGDAFRDGQAFWTTTGGIGGGGDGARKSTTAATAAAAAVAAAAAASADRSPIAALRVLCIRSAASNAATATLINDDTSEALVFAQPFKAEWLAPVRYLVQWRQRIALGHESGGGSGSQYDEIKWITASVGFFFALENRQWTRQPICRLSRTPFLRSAACSRASNIA